MKKGTDRNELNSSDEMEGRTNRSPRPRKPLRFCDNKNNYSPPPGSPNAVSRDYYRHMSPNLIDNGSMESDSENKEFCGEMDSSPDMPDGDNFRRTFQAYKKTTVKFDGGEFKQTTILRKTVQPAEQHRNQWLLVVAILVIVVSIAIPYYPAKIESGRMLCSFNTFQDRFPNQNNILWKSLEYSVEKVLNNKPTSPSIFLLAYQDVDSAKKLTQSIVQRTTECMQSTVHAVELNSDDLKSNAMIEDYGIVIAKYKTQLAKSGVMLVNDLNKVPAEVVPAFHSFCDVDNPLVDRSIIFLTIQLTTQIRSSSYTNTLEVVEKYLRSNWSELDSNILEPLITRVTDQVFVLNREK